MTATAIPEPDFGGVEDPVAEAHKELKRLENRHRHLIRQQTKLEVELQSIEVAKAAAAQAYATALHHYHASRQS